MNNIWNGWMEAFRLACEAQNVIAARMLVLAAGTPDAVVEETARMVTEKFLAFAKAGIAAEQAFEEGLDVFAAAERAYRPLQACVHANNARLRHTVH